MTTRAVEQMEAWVLPLVLAILIGVLGYNWVQMDTRLARIEHVIELGCAALK